MDAKRIARAGLMVALLAASAQVMLPFGPVPFTLQTFVLAMIPAVLDRRTASLRLSRTSCSAPLAFRFSPASWEASVRLRAPRAVFCGDSSWAW